MYQHLPNVHTCMCFWEVGWWMAEGYVEARRACWSEAERKGPAAAVCEEANQQSEQCVMERGEGRFSAVCLTHKNMSESLPAVNHTLNLSISLMSQFVGPEVLLYYTAPISPSQSSHLSKKKWFLWRTDLLQLFAVLQLCPCFPFGNSAQLNIHTKWA